MALDWAPRTVQAKSTVASRPVDWARAGIKGNRAGVTTPVVELKKLMNAATRLKAIGTRATGTLEPIHADRASMVPASTATAISIPAPAIMIIVFHGTLAMTSFCGARFINNAMTVKQMATSPTSTLLLIALIKEFPGRIIFNSGKTRTTAIISSIRVRVFFCFSSKGSGFLKVIPFPMFLFSLKP